jgi:hypothetical protein
MPGISANAGAWVFQGLELQPAFRQAHHPPVFDQAGSVGRYQMCHFVPLPHVTVEPKSTVHRVYHPVATLLELDVLSGPCQRLHFTP